MSKVRFIPMLVFVFLFSTIFSSVGATEASGKFTNNTSVETYTETYTDEAGNEGILEYVITKDEVKVYSYVNGILKDYSVSTGNSEDDGVIDTYIVADGTNIEFGEQIPQNIDIQEHKSYAAEDVIQEVELKDGEIEDGEVTAYAVPGMKWIRSTNLGGVVGHLYKDSFVTNTKVYQFDFAKDMLISTIATRITLIWSTTIVAVATLIGALGVTILNNKIRTPLNGYYNAKLHQDNYVVQVSNRNVYYHTSERVVVTYYNQQNGKQAFYNKYKSNYLMEADILSKGIQIAMRQGIY